MKEYNWREARDKYRPDFQKENTPAGGEIASEPVRKTFPGKLFITAGIIVLAAVIAGGVFIFKSKDSSTLLAEAAEKHKTAVGLVALTVELQDGQKLTMPGGTAWAFSENRFATNGHVANGLREQ